MKHKNTHHNQSKSKYAIKRSPSKESVASGASDLTPLTSNKLSTAVSTQALAPAESKTLSSTLLLHDNLSVKIESIDTPKTESLSKFSIVSAVYNVGKYLDEYFESIVNQSIHFEKNIEIILVDDGSTDNSSDIIAKWAKLFPNNIRYVYQDNGGQGSARNTGLTYAKHDWVTFIDPDDFIDRNYFASIDQSINENKISKPVKMVCSSCIFYFEDTGEIRDGHPLRSRFSNGDTVISIKEVGKFITLNVTCVTFRRSRILEHNIKFDPLLKPSFEDGLFVNQYLLTLEEGYISVLPSSKYYYRKRQDSSSTLDTGWQQTARFGEQLKRGYLKLFQDSIKQYGVVKESIQRTVLYDISWHIRKALNDDSRLSIISHEQDLEYQSLIEEIMGHISIATLLSFELAGMWFYHKVGMLAYYKNYSPDFNIAYIDAIDQLKDLVKIRYFTSDKNSLEHAKWDDKLSIPVFDTIREHTLFNKIFIYERIVWLRVGDNNTLTFSVNGTPARLSLKGTQHRKGITSQEIRESFTIKPLNTNDFPEDILSLRNYCREQEVVQQYGNCWILMDRDINADDNAEHLYRYLKTNQPRIKIFFAINSSATDWTRLENEGFNLLEFGSVAYKLALLNASHLISSHADHYMTADLQNKWFGDLLSYRYTFLQHGIIKDNLSNWLNGKNIDLFVTTTSAEHNSIVSSGPYKFSSKEVIRTGLARHDKLLAKSGESNNTILIMPTWRKDLVGKNIGLSNEREINPQFTESLFFKSWHKVLHSSTIKQIAKNRLTKIVFLPHPNIQPYLTDFDIPNYIKTESFTSKDSIQEYFSAASVLITDYSSVAFEMAFLNKPVIYYQFDKSYIYNGTHTYQPGYYDYERDGFGPVHENYEDLLKHLVDIVAENCTMQDIYINRAKQTFSLYDGQNCRRTYLAIDALDKSTLDEDSITRTMQRYARRLSINKDWDNAYKLWNSLRTKEISFKESDYFYFSSSCRHTGNIEEASSILDIAEKANVSKSRIIGERFKISIESNDLTSIIKTYEDAGQLHNDIVSQDSSLLALVARAYRLNNEYNKAKQVLSSSQDISHTSLALEKSEIYSLEENWQLVIDTLTNVNFSVDTDRASILLAQAYRKFGNIDIAKTALDQVKNSRSTPEYLEEKAEISYAKSKWSDAEKTWSELLQTQQLSSDTMLKLAKTKRKSKKPDEANKILKTLDNVMDQRTLLQEIALVNSSMKNWLSAIDAWKLFISRKDLSPNRDAWLYLAIAEYESGVFRDANDSLKKFESLCKSNSESEALGKKLSLINTSVDKEQAVKNRSKLHVFAKVFTWTTNTRNNRKKHKRKISVTK